MTFPFKWVREPTWHSDCGQVIVLEMNPDRVLPAVSVQSDWNGCKGIIRGIKDSSGFLVEDHISEELKAGRPVDIGHPIVGADEIRKQVWSIDQHKFEFMRQHSDQQIVGWVGNGNLLSNLHFVAFAEGSLFHLAEENGQLENRSYTSLVVRKPGYKRVSIEALTYRASSDNLQVLTDSDDDITDQVQFATFGQQLVADGRPVDHDRLKTMAVAQQFYDLRHLFLFGRIPAGEKRWIDAGLGAFWDNGMLNTDAVESALDGKPVTVDVRQFDERAIYEAMDGKGYDKVTKPVNRGEFSHKGGKLEMVLLEGLYPHNMIGIRNDGCVISVVLRGLSNRLGVSMQGAAEIMAGLGAEDAVLIDNGGDVMMGFWEDQVLGSAEGERNRIRSVLLFRTEAGKIPLSPEDLRLVVYPKQYATDR